eukprot:s1098_g16.t1
MAHFRPKRGRTLEFSMPALSSEQRWTEACVSHGCEPGETGFRKQDQLQCSFTVFWQHDSRTAPRRIASVELEPFAFLLPLEIPGVSWAPSSQDILHLTSRWSTPRLGEAWVQSQWPGPSCQGTKALQCENLSYCYGGGATIHDRALSEPKLIDVSCAFEEGCRVLVVGGNGAGKSTLLSIMGGKKMIPRSDCKILGKPVFHDSTLNLERMYCGDWWRTDFFFNITVAELIGDKLLNTPRVQELIDIMQINTTWYINAISDGQRRRCQLLECLAEEKKVYILDEITTDLDLFAREGLLRFLRRESEEKGATIFYATHIFDHLAEWATHVLYFAQGKIE